MTMLNFGRDVQGYNAYAPAFSVDNKSTILSANIEQHFTVPSDFENWIAVFSFEPGTSVWVANNQTSNVPSASFADTFSQLNPAARLVNAGDVLSFISPDTTASIGISLYAV